MVIKLSLPLEITPSINLMHSEERMATLFNTNTKTNYTNDCENLLSSVLLTRI